MDEYTKALLVRNGEEITDECGVTWSENGDYLWKTFSGLNGADATLTYEALVKTDVEIEKEWDTRILVLRPYAAEATCWYIYITENGELTIVDHSSEEVILRVETKADRKNHFAFVYEKEIQALKVYINGKEKGVIENVEQMTNPELTVTKSLKTAEWSKIEFSYGIARWTQDFKNPIGVEEYSKKLRGRYTGGVEAVPLFEEPHSESYMPFFDKATNKTVYADLVETDTTVASHFRVKRNGQVYSLMKFKEIALQVSGTEFEYNGQEQGPTLSGYADGSIELSGQNKAINAGSYRMNYWPAYGHKWSDGTEEEKRLDWSIEKVTCNASLSSYSVTLDNDSPRKTVQVSREGDGKISAVSDDTDIATASVSGSEVTVTGVGTGTSQATVKVAEGTNHLASSDMIIEVKSEILPALSECTPEQIQQIIRAGLHKKAWKVGDCTAAITLSTIKISGSVNYDMTISGDYYAYILGFDHDIEGTVDFCLGRKTPGGVDIAFCDKAYGKTYYSGMNYQFLHRKSGTASNTGGWGSSYLRKTMLPKFYAALPDEWKAVIIRGHKHTDNTGNASNQESDVNVLVDYEGTNYNYDYLWLPSEYEVCGEHVAANEYEYKFQKQYEYYAKGASRIRYKHSALTTAAAWWLRSPAVTCVTASKNKTNYCIVNAEGVHSPDAGVSNYSRGLVPCFTIG